MRWHNGVDRNVLQRVRRHARVQRFGRILDDRHTPTRLDRREAGCAVIPVARQHDADDARVPGGGGRAKQHIDGRPMTVLTRTDRKPDAAVLDHQMAIWWCDENLPGAQDLAVNGRTARKWTGSLENLGQCARATRRYMQDDADRRGQIGWETGGDSLQSLDAARGGTDHDQVMIVTNFVQHLG